MGGVVASADGGDEAGSMEYKYSMSWRPNKWRGEERDTIGAGSKRLIRLVDLLRKVVLYLLERCQYR